MNQQILEQAIQLRHLLHQHPELSGKEKQTKQILMQFLRLQSHLELVDQEQWFYACYHPQTPNGKILAFRADFDAIAVNERKDWDYGSLHPGVAHKCGHDGHSAALAAFALEIEQVGSDTTIYFIFQHGEENGSGAKVCASLIQEKKIQEIYAVHNFPGYPLGTLCIKKGTICCASKGLELTFTGVSSHASEPEKGINPASAISQLILDLPKMTQVSKDCGLVMATLVQIAVGERAFGVSAHQGKVLLTIRSEVEQELNRLENNIIKTAKQYANRDHLQFEVAYHDVFPETYHLSETIDHIQKVAFDHHFPVKILEEPLRTSEDFGYYLKETKGALIWLGAGESCSPLHSENFDYNDELIEKTVELFQALL